MIPHVTGAVKYKLRDLAMHGGSDGGPADVVCVEVGGTAGDYENGFYIEALRELAFEEGPESACFVALTYILEPQILGEQKSKAAQLGIKRLMEAGIQPNLVACRAKNPVNETVMEKIGMFSNVPMTRIFSMHDRDSVYSIPEEMRKASLDREILSMLDLHDRVNPIHEDESRHRWSDFARRLSAPDFSTNGRIIYVQSHSYREPRRDRSASDPSREGTGYRDRCGLLQSRRGWSLA